MARLGSWPNLIGQMSPRIEWQWHRRWREWTEEALSVDLAASEHQARNGVFDRIGFVLLLCFRQGLDDGTAHIGFAQHVARR